MTCDLTKACSWRGPASIALVFIALLCAAFPALAQSPRRVQILSGKLDPGGQAVYLLSGLKQDQRLYVYLETTSGNLDPIVSILDSQVDLDEVYDQFTQEAARAAAGSNPSAALNALRDRFSLAWDDDSGRGYAAALEFRIPQDGDYRLLVGSAFSSVGRQTFGRYRLLVGIEAPQVLSGEAQVQGEPFVQLEAGAFQSAARIQGLTGQIDPQASTKTYNLIDLSPGDTLYAYIEVSSGDLRPALILRDFGGKPLTAANLSGDSSSASLQFHFSERIENASLNVFDGRGSQEANGEFILYLGVNSPEVLTGEAQPSELPVVLQPIEVMVGIKLQQIVQVNQQDEFFSAVGSLQMDWTDPALAFSPDSCQCSRKVYTEKEFDRFLSDIQGRWPDFTFYNQQGNRWVQNRVVVLESDGHAIYFERFTTNFQVDFDFRRYPFDVQQFSIRMDMLYPENSYYFADLPGYSEISGEHGEDEFIIQNFSTLVSSVQSSTRQTTSRFTFSFEAPRHLSYYLFRIFIPILLIVLISWWTFFLKDYTKRIEVAAGNVLLFIAFSFSLAENYPRLGYLTFLDAIMAIVFIINSLILIYNVFLKRLEMNGHGDRAEQIDQVLDWAYPLIYLAALVVVYVIFFVLNSPAA